MAVGDYEKNKIEYYMRRGDAIPQMSAANTATKELNYKLKGMVKRMPFLKKLVAPIYYCYRDYRVHRVDLSSIMDATDEVFFAEVADKLLSRPMSDIEAYEVSLMVADGLSREGVIYFLLRSRDCVIKKRTVVRRFRYGLSYYGYRISKRLYSLPVIGTLSMLLSIRPLLRRIQLHISELYKLQTQIEEQSKKNVQLLVDLEKQKTESYKLQTQIKEQSKKNAQEFTDLEKQNRQTLDYATSQIVEVKEYCKQSNEKCKTSYEELDNRINEIYEIKYQFEDESIPAVFQTNGILSRDSYYDTKKRDDNFNGEELSSFYLQMAKLFRGSEEELKTRLKSYLPHIAQGCSDDDGKKTVLDIGCGTGVFLDVLRDYGYDTVGVDINADSSDVAIERGHKVILEDAEVFLREESDGSYLAITMLEVAEHISFEKMARLIGIIVKKLKRNGCFIMETINPYCYSKFGAFRLDPSHIQYPSPDAYKLLMEMLGFSKVEMYFYAPIEHPKKKEPYIYNYEGYYLVARK